MGEQRIMYCCTFCAEAMRERALFLTSGIEQLDRIIWPSDDSGTAQSPQGSGQ